jgi:hypothetical protein
LAKDLTQNNLRHLIIRSFSKIYSLFFLAIKSVSKCKIKSYLLFNMLD